MRDLETCALCRKPRHSHQLNTGACPTGKKTRFGYVTFHKENRFEEAVGGRDAVEVPEVRRDS